MVNQQELVLKNSQTNQKPTLEEFADGVRLTEQAEAIQNKKIEFGAPRQIAKADNCWEGVENGLLNVMNYYKDSNLGLFYYFTENYQAGKYSAEYFAYTVGVMWQNTELLCTIIKDINWQLIEEQKEKLRLIRENEAVTGNLAELMASLIPNPEQYKDTDPASKLPWALSFIRNEREVNKKRIAELEIELDQKEKIITEIKAALAREGEEAEKLEKLLFKTEENLVKSLQENKKLSEELSEKKGKVSQLDSLFSRGLEKIRKIGRIIALNTKNKNELNIWEKVENLDYLDNLEKMVADLVKEKNSLEETLNVGIEKFHHLDEENKLLREENKILKKKWVASEEKLANSEKQKIELVSQLSEENRKLNVQLTNSQRENNNLNTKINGLKAELDQALKKLPMMKKMIEDEIHRITGIRCNVTVNEVISKERERERERERN